MPSVKARNRLIHSSIPGRRNTDTWLSLQTAGDSPESISDSLFIIASCTGSDRNGILGSASPWIVFTAA